MDKFTLTKENFAVTFLEVYQAVIKEKKHVFDFADEFDEIFMRSNDCNDHDKVLIHLFLANEKVIRELIDANIQDSIEYGAEGFHKSFRQFDVTGNGHIDMAIYFSLCGAKIFWEVWSAMAKIQSKNLISL